MGSRVQASQVRKILVLSHMYPSAAAPEAGVFIQRHVEALRDAGLQVEVVSPVPWVPWLLTWHSRWRGYAEQVRRHPELVDTVRRPAYPVLPSPFYVLAGLTMAARLLPTLGSLARREGFDVLHAHTVTPDGFAAAALQRRLGVPTVCSIRGSDVHEYPFRSRLWMRMSVWSLTHNDRIVAVSQAMADLAQNLTAGGVCPKVIYNGIDDRLFAPGPGKEVARGQLGLPADARAIVFVGRCERDKGLGELWEAFLDLRSRHRHAMLVLVGAGSFAKELAERATGNGCSESVRFAGQIRPELVAMYLRAADVFVLPSYGEGMPNALLEAMAIGLPVVASRVGGIPEVVEDRVSGLLVEPKSARALSRALDQLLGQPVWAAGLGREGSRRIRTQFSWRQNAEEHLELYEDLLKEWTRRRAPSN